MTSFKKIPISDIWQENKAFVAIYMQCLTV